MMISCRNIVLTGANSGIGLETLKILSENGNTIIAADLRDDRISSFDSEKVIPYACDVSKKENIDALFEFALQRFEKIDIFIANAGYNHFEKMDGADWEKIEKIFSTNTISPIYSYQKYSEHLNGRDGIFAITISAMGKMAMPGFTLYSSTKFALNGFQESVRFEKDDNIQLTCVYPVSTDTAFFDSPAEIEKPWPVQTPEHVAAKMIRGIEKGKKKVFPSRMFRFSLVLFTIFPFTKSIYIKKEKKKFLRHEERLRKL
jgi:Short-chain dehydrogenases of various substrate specificities